MIHLLRALMITLTLLISVIFSIVYCGHAIWLGDWPWIWPPPWAHYVFSYSNVEEDVMLDELSSFSYSTLLLFVGCWLGYRLGRAGRQSS